MSGPPEDAYGRVTRPERFAPLHDAADSIVERLERDFDVQNVDGLEVDPVLAGRVGGCLRLLRLTPSDPTAAPITFGWSAFPGLVVRFGRWHVTAFPRCGCDACDEQPDGVADELHELVDDIVGGRFAESYDGRELSHQRWSATSTSRSSGGMLVAGTDLARDLGDPGAVHWRPWPRRPSPG
jgi:hypothetical protein